MVGMVLGGFWDTTCEAFGVLLEPCYTYAYTNIEAKQPLFFDAFGHTTIEHKAVKTPRLFLLHPTFMLDQCVETLSN